MKKFLLITLLGACFFWNSCSNDFDVAAPWQDIPVVYGLLNAKDKVHYIRVEKAFLNSDSDANEIAQIADSLYYENAIVQLEKVNTGEIFTMTRVDGNDPSVNLPREEGVFANAPNWLYKIDSAEIKFAPGDSIQLLLDRGNGKPIVKAGTVIQAPGTLRKPESGKNMSFIYSSPERIQWSVSPDARIFDVVLYFNYAEYDKADPSMIFHKTVKWVWARGLRFDLFANSYDREKEAIEFFQVLKNNIPVNTDYVRIFKTIEVEVAAGGRALEKYVTVANANSGITGSQEIPSYTNLSEGLGVFSSINFLRSNNVLISPAARDSLRFGSITGNLSFQ